MKWKILNSEIVFKTNHFEIEKDKCQKSDGKIIESYYTMNKSDVVVIAAFTKNKEIVLIKQYRHPVKDIDHEVPAGYIDEGEDIEIAAERELLEETGFKAEKLIHLKTTYASAGTMNNNVYFFIGLNAEKIQEQKLDETEELIVEVMKWEKALEMFNEGKIKDMASFACMYIAKEYLENNE